MLSDDFLGSELKGWVFFIPSQVLAALFYFHHRHHTNYLISHFITISQRVCLGNIYVDLWIVFGICHISFIFIKIKAEFWVEKIFWEECAYVMLIKRSAVYKVGVLWGGVDFNSNHNA